MSPPMACSDSPSQPIRSCPAVHLETAAQIHNFGQKITSADPERPSSRLQTPLSPPSPPPATTTMKAADALPGLYRMLEQGGTLEAALGRVAADTGVSVSALRMADHRATKATESRHGNTKLTADQEDVLVGTCQAFSINNLPLSAAQVRQLIDRKWGAQVSEKWVRRFVKRRRASLSTRACKALADKRTGARVLANVKVFTQELSAFLKTRHFPPSAVMNYDETRVVVRGNQLATRRVVSADTERANAASTRTSAVASLLTFVAAEGSVFLSVYVMKSSFGEADQTDVEFFLKEAPRVSRRSWPRYYC